MNHIELTIQDLTAARNRVDLLIDSLRQFQVGAYELVVPTATPAPSAPTSPLVPSADVVPIRNGPVKAADRMVRPTKSPCASTVPRGTAKQGKAPRKAGRNPEQSERLLKVVATLAEPFGPMELAKAAKLEQKTASNFIMRRTEAGWFVKMGHGRYVRGKIFPKQGEAETQKPTNGNGAAGLNRMETQSVKPVAKPSLFPTPKFTPPAAPPLSTESRLAEKPTSLGAAMKTAVRQQSRFTGEALRNLMLTDAHNKTLFESASGGLFQANLSYWAKQGYLLMVGETPLDAMFTVTEIGKEWFGK